MIYLQNVLKEQEKHKPLNEENLNVKKIAPVETSNWVKNFVNKKDWLISVDSVYLNDPFNLTGLNGLVENYSLALSLIQDQTPENEKNKVTHLLQKDAEILYCLIHARYVLTTRGVDAISQKFHSGLYGHCRRIGCKKQNLLPIGESNVYGDGPVRVYCPCCKDIYKTDYDLDGSAFGLYFPQFFIQASLPRISIHQCESNQLTFGGIPIDPEGQLARVKTPIE